MPMHGQRLGGGLRVGVERAPSGAFCISFKPLNSMHFPTLGPARAKNWPLSPINPRFASLLFALLASLGSCQYLDQVTPEGGASTRAGLKGGPKVRIVSPVAGARVTPGEGTVGAGSFNGTGFSLHLEIITDAANQVPAREGLNIRNTSLLGGPNPNLPGLSVTFDVDLIKPDGGVIPKHTNLASLFNIAGTDDTPRPGVTLWAGWHVLESLPAGVDRFTITASLEDREGRTGLDKITLKVGKGTGGEISGQALTPAPPATPPGDLADDPDGPVVTMIAPRVPSSVAIGPANAPMPPASGSLFFIQVSALDKTGAGIGVNETGEGRPENERGTIEDRTQSSRGPNRFATGLHVTFDVDLLQPNGNVIKAGDNLAPVFNIAGSEIDPSGRVRTTFGWVVGGTLVVPEGKTWVTIRLSVTDNTGRTGSASQVVQLSPVTNGQNLTPAP